MSAVGESSRSSLLVSAAMPKDYCESYRIEMRGELNAWSQRRSWPD